MLDVFYELIILYFYSFLPNLVFLPLSLLTLAVWVDDSDKLSHAIMILLALDWIVKKLPLMEYSSI